MSEDFQQELRSQRRSKALDLIASRFAFTVAMTLLISFFNRDSLSKDPNALKWLLITIWVDVFAYLMGFLRGFATGASAVVRRLLDIENDIIGGKGDRHEE